MPTKTPDTLAAHINGGGWVKRASAFSLMDRLDEETKARLEEGYQNDRDDQEW